MRPTWMTRVNHFNETFMARVWHCDSFASSWMPLYLRGLFCIHRLLSARAGPYGTRHSKRRNQGGTDHPRHPLLWGGASTVRHGGCGAEGDLQDLLRAPAWCRSWNSTRHSRLGISISTLNASRRKTGCDMQYT